jgi:hypothetical protein
MGLRFLDAQKVDWRGKGKKIVFGLYAAELIMHT